MLRGPQAVSAVWHWKLLPTWLSTLEAQINSLAPNDQSRLQWNTKASWTRFITDNLYITGMTLRRNMKARISAITHSVAGQQTPAAARNKVWTRIHPETGWALLARGSSLFFRGLSLNNCVSTDQPDRR